MLCIGLKRLNNSFLARALSRVAPCSLCLRVPLHHPGVRRIRRQGYFCREKQNDEVVSPRTLRCTSCLIDTTANRTRYEVRFLSTRQSGYAMGSLVDQPAAQKGAVWNWRHAGRGCLGSFVSGHGNRCAAAVNARLGAVDTRGRTR